MCNSPEDRLRKCQSVRSGRGYNRPCLFLLFFFFFPLYRYSQRRKTTFVFRLIRFALRLPRTVLRPRLLLCRADVPRLRSPFLIPATSSARDINHSVVDISWFYPSFTQISHCCYFPRFKDFTIRSVNRSGSFL